MQAFFHVACVAFDAVSCCCFFAVPAHDITVVMHAMGAHYSMDIRVLGITAVTMHDMVFYAGAGCRVQHGCQGAGHHRVQADGAIRARH